jgi:hypothetical protein
VRGAVPFIEEDRVMHGYIEAVRRLVGDGRVVREVGRAMARESKRRTR